MRENETILKDVKKGDAAAENELVSQNLGLVHSVLSHYRNSSVEYEDLFQAGCIGLLKAARAFEPEKGNAFSTYAVCVIAGEIKRTLRDSSPVKMSRTLREIHMRVCRGKTKLIPILGREPTVSELAAETGDDAESIILAEEANMAVLSLDMEQGDDGAPLSDAVGTDPTESLEEMTELGLAVEKLMPFERSVIVLRYFKGKTQCETAAALGVTQVRISRCERKVLDELRKKIS